jgi:hypothetical protein
MTHPVRRLCRAVVGAAVVTVVLAGSTAEAAPAAGHHATWTVSGANPTWTGAVAVPGTTFPDGRFATDGNTPTVPSGAAAFLNASTPFGAGYGSSENDPYLSLRTAAGNAPSTTVITFSAPTPATGWAFALGDIDADAVSVTAKAADGSPLPVAALGFQGTFHYRVAAPKPSSCSGNPMLAALPTWNASTATLTGGGVDTSGASGWFAPDEPISSLQLVFTRLAGIPVYQLWIAATTASISGTIAEPNAPAAGATVNLDTPAGDPVLDHKGDPVTTTTDASGAFAFTGVVTGRYDVVVEPPSGFVAPAPRAVDTRAGDVSGIALTLAADTVTTTTPTTSAPTPTVPATTIAPVAQPNQLPRTGSSPFPLVGAAFAAILLGVLLASERGARR